MSFTERVPGMRPGSLGRNLIVAAVYLAFIWVWPLVAGYYVGRNRSGTAEKLSRLPGVSESGGLLTGVVVAIGGYVLLLTLSVAAPDTETDAAADGADFESTADGVADQPSDSTSANSDSDTSISSAADTEDGADGEASSTSGPDGGSTNEEADTSSETDDETSTESDNTVTVEVVDVIDGDTMDIQYENGTDDTVRLIGVDTPEVYTDVSPDEYEGVPDTEPGRQCLGRYGDEASEFAEQELAGETVQLRFDALSDRRGSFDRLLVYIMYDGENFNHLLLDEGLARVYDSTFSESERFYDTEAAERESQTGVWSCQNAGDGGDSGSDADDGGSQTSGTTLEIVEINEDAEGEERENLNDEYVTFRNEGDESLDLSGWVVEDEADHDYTVPDGFTLNPGADVTLHTGQGEDTDTDLYWGQESPVWNNAGDTVYVTNADGETVIERSYE